MFGCHVLLSPTGTLPHHSGLLWPLQAYGHLYLLHTMPYPPSVGGQTTARSLFPTFWHLLSLPKHMDGQEDRMPRFLTVDPVVAGSEARVP